MIPKQPTKQSNQLPLWCCHYLELILSMECFFFFAFLQPVCFLVPNIVTYYSPTKFGLITSVMWLSRDWNSVVHCYLSIWLQVIQILPCVRVLAGQLWSISGPVPWPLQFLDKQNNLLTCQSKLTIIIWFAFHSCHDNWVLIWHCFQTSYFKSLGSQEYTYP